MLRFLVEAAVIGLTIASVGGYRPLGWKISDKVQVWINAAALLAAFFFLRDIINLVDSFLPAINIGNFLVVSKLKWFLQIFGALLFPAGSILVLFGSALLFSDRNRLGAVLFVLGALLLILLASNNLL